MELASAVERYTKLRDARAEKAGELKELSRDFGEAHDALLEAMKESGVDTVEIGDKILCIHEKLKEIKPKKEKATKSETNDDD